MKSKVKLLGAFACFVFLVSIFFPFLQAFWQGMSIPETRLGPITLWSFKGTIEYTILRSGRVVQEYWFSDYWFLDMMYRYEDLGQWIAPALILTLASQILVVLVSATAILMDKSRLFVFSIILNAVTLFCMLLVIYALQYNYESYPVAGFWLTLMAAALFAVCGIEFLCGGPEEVDFSL